MTRLDLAGRSAHPPGIKALEVRIDGMIFGRHQIPRGDARPSSHLWRLAKDLAEDRLLGSCHHARLGNIHILREDIAKLDPIDVEKTSRIGDQASAKQTRILPEERANRFAGHRRKGSKIYQ